MNKFRFDLSFRISHPSLDPDSVAAALGLRVFRKWKAGEPRSTPKGQALDGLYKESYLSLRISHETDEDLAEVIQKTTRHLQKHAELLGDISASGGTLEFFIGWYSDGNSGEVFDAALIKQLAELGIGLSLDFYGGPENTSRRL